MGSIISNAAGGIGKRGGGNMCQRSITHSKNRTFSYAHSNDGVNRQEPDWKATLEQAQAYAAIHQQSNPRHEPPKPANYEDYLLSNLKSARIEAERRRRVEEIEREIKKLALNRMKIGDLLGSF